MGLCIGSNAILQCSFGAAPTPLTVIPQNMVNVSSQPMATIMDNKPFVNIKPFGMCTSVANPAVATATLASYGIYGPPVNYTAFLAALAAANLLTPMPCVPATAAPWAPGSPTVLIKGVPALTDSSVLMCACGGVIKCNMAAQFTAYLK